MDKSTSKEIEQPTRPRKTLTPRQGGTTVIQPDQQEEITDGASNQKSGRSRKN